MASTLLRYVGGLLYAGIGLFLTSLVLFATIVRAVFKGRKGIVGLFRRGKHDIEPESKQQFYNLRISDEAYSIFD